MKGGSSKEKGSKQDKKPQIPLPEIAVDDFARVSFRVEDFVSQLAGPVIGQHGAPPGKAGGQPSLSEVKQLLSHFERWALWASSTSSGPAAWGLLLGARGQQSGTAAGLPCLPCATCPACLCPACDRCDREISKLQTQVDLKAERLKRELAQEEELYQVRLEGAPTGSTLF